MPGWQQLRACLDDADITILEPYGDEPLDEVLEDVGGVMNLVSPDDDDDVPADPTDPAQWGNPGWQEFLALEDNYSQAEWACRQEVYEQYIDGLMPLIESFSQEHAAQIAKAQQQWSEISAEAQRLGHHG